MRNKLLVATIMCGVCAAILVSPAFALDPVAPDAPRVSANEKGSFLVYPKVEIRWDGDGNVIQDTFIDITNDYPADVYVQMHFVNGDVALDAVVDDYGNIIERPHLGCNWVDVMIELTANEPTFWSAITGLPKGTSPFTILDPGDPQGRPDPDGSGNRVLRGFILAWAVNEHGEEIAFNHLKGDALLVNYMNGSAWEYTTYAFSALGGLPVGTQLTTSKGTLELNGEEYDACYSQLLLDFYAVGSEALSGGGRLVSVNTDLTLLPMIIDLTQNGEGLIITKANFDIWNMNEWKFSGTHRCVECWDQTLLSNYDAPNHFLVYNLHTDKGKARIEGHASESDCPGSVETPLLGVAMKMLTFDGDVDFAQAGMNLVGMGRLAGEVQADVLGGPPPEKRDESTTIGVKRVFGR